MNKANGLLGIDVFRIICAFLVVAIHVFPFADISQTGDFVFSHVLARVAVPFFFMTTGFFIFYEKPGGRQEGNRVQYLDKIRSFLKKTSLLYAIAILLYLPVNVYAGYFKNITPMKMVRDIVLNGTFYHLWYLPSVILGVVVFVTLACIVPNRNGVQRKLRVMLVISVILYLIGLFGDSYYGVAEKVPAVHSFYQILFGVFSYTRNGLFFAPVFLVLGALEAKRTKEKNLSKMSFGLELSLGAMVAEGMLLRMFEVQRHDSMYIFLVPVMYFLFSLLVEWRGESSKSLRELSMLIYILHPLMIVLVRGAAKVIGLQSILVDNNLIHYLEVSLASVAVGALYLFISILREERRYHEKAGMD